MHGKKALLHPVPFPSLAQASVICSYPEIVWEARQHFEKQTYRNRYYIHGAHGKQMLSIPVRHGKSSRHVPMEEVLIANEFDWQRQHWKSLETAYRTSPYFEFYEDDIRPLFEQKYERLMDFNIDTVRTVCRLLGKEIKESRTRAYSPESGDADDFRFLVDAKKKFDFDTHWEPYFQVFSGRNGFIPGLSVLDLLFMLGPEAERYLKEHGKRLLGIG